MAIWTYEYYAENGGLTEEQAIAAIETIIESVIQSPLGGWPMEELLGQVGPHTGDLIRRAIEGAQSILNAARAIPEHVDMDNLPPQIPRTPDIIHVTGHKLYFGKGHLALEYAGPASSSGTYSPTTLSGAAEHWPPVICWGGIPPSQCGFGKLLAETNRPGDLWYLNFRVGHVLPFIGAASTYWHNTLTPRHNRYMNLPHESKMNYDPLPDAILNTYNSNSYARGLNGSGGFFVVPPEMNSVYPGWDRPVPDVMFR